MAFSTDIEAKSPEVEVPAEMELPSMESAPAESGAPGLLGLLSQPSWAVKLVLAAGLIGAVAILFTPAAFPPRAWRQPPPLPPRVPARLPRRLPPTPLPEWMRAQPSRPGVGSRPTAHPPATARSTGGVAAGAAAAPEPSQAEKAPPAYPIRIQELSGATCIVTRGGVAV